MGDRANVCVRDSDRTSGVFLYTHWGGHELPESVRVSLAKRWRWDDTPYLTRIVFCDMVSGSEQGETGYGIASYEQDNSYPVIYVTTETQTVQIGDRNWTFDEYVAQESAAWPK